MIQKSQRLPQISILVALGRFDFRSAGPEPRAEMRAPISLNTSAYQEIERKN